MAGFQDNPFYGNPYIENISKNLIDAFRPDSRDAVNAAKAAHTRAETDKLQGETAARGAAAEAVQNFDPRQPIANAFMQNLYANYVRGGMRPEDASALVLGMVANGQADDATVGRAFVGAGHAIGKDQGFSVADREGIAKRENDAAMARTSTSAGIAAGASRANNADTLNERAREFGIEQQYKQDHRFDAPHNVAPGDAVFFKPEDPRFAGATTGSVPAPKPDHYVQAFDPNSPTGRSLQPVGPGVPVPAPADHYVQTPGIDGKPVYQPVAPGLPAAPKDTHDPNATPGIVDQIEINALSNIGAWDPVNKRVDPEFYQQNAEKMLAAKLALGETYRKTGDSAKAEAAYQDAMGFKIGSTFQKGGLTGHWGGSGMFDPQGNRLPAGTQQAAPTVVPTAKGNVTIQKVQ